MPTRYIAIAPESGVNPSDLARVSAAVQKQVTRDLAPVWHVSATVDPFPSLEDVPAGYWPIILTFRPLGTEAGIHIDSNGQPYALIEMSPSWSLTASHVTIEMITDPFGSRSIPGASPRDDHGDVEFRGGVCDPCEHPDSAYLVNDVLVSDFCTPAFWEPAAKGRRSFTGTIQEPYQILPGGHLCWYDPATNTWWLRRLSDGVLTDIEVGMIDPEHGTVREFLCRHSLHLQSTKLSLEAFEARVGITRQRAMRASQSRAYWLRTSLLRAHSARPLEFEAHVRAELSAAPSPRPRAAQPPLSAQTPHLPRVPPSVPPPVPQAPRVAGEFGADDRADAPPDGEDDVVPFEASGGASPAAKSDLASESDLVTTVYVAPDVEISTSDPPRTSERPSKNVASHVDLSASDSPRASERSPKHAASAESIPDRPRPLQPSSPEGRARATSPPPPLPGSGLPPVTPPPPRASLRVDPPPRISPRTDPPRTDSPRDDLARSLGTTVRPAFSSIPPPARKSGTGWIPLGWGVLLGLLVASFAGASAYVLRRSAASTSWLGTSEPASLPAGGAAGTPASAAVALPPSERTVAPGDLPAALSNIASGASTAAPASQPPSPAVVHTPPGRAATAAPGRAAPNAASQAQPPVVRAPPGRVATSATPGRAAPNAAAGSQAQPPASEPDVESIVDEFGGRN